MNGLTEEAKLILKEAVSSPSRRVMRVQYHNGAVEFKAGRKTLIIESNGRVIAAWNWALEELVTQGLLNKIKDDPQTQTFEVTKKGYEYAE